MPNTEKQNAIYFWVGSYIIFMMATISLTGFSLIQNNQIDLLVEENECLKANQTINQVNERKINTQCEIIEYLEEEVDQCKVLRREYDRWLEKKLKNK